MNLWLGWEDFRNENKGDIYGTRVNIYGDVLEKDGFPVCNEEGIQSSPVITFNKNYYFVIWSGEQVIYGSRVTPLGKVLDSPGFKISPSSCCDFPSVVSDSNRCFVVWVYKNIFLDSFCIYGARITSEGKVLDPQGIYITTLKEWYKPVIVRGKEGYIVLFADTFLDTDIYAKLIGQNGREQKGRFLITREEKYDEIEPFAVFSPSECLITWGTILKNKEFHIAWAGFINPAELTIQEPIFIDSREGSKEWECGREEDYILKYPIGVFDGEKYLLVWSTYFHCENWEADYWFDYSDIWGSFISPHQKILDSIFNIRNEDFENFIELSIASSSNGYLISFMKWIERSIGWVFLDTQGRKLNEFMYLTDDEHFKLSSASNGEDFIIIWRDEEGLWGRRDRRRYFHRF